MLPEPEKHTQGSEDFWSEALQLFQQHKKQSLELLKIKTGLETPKNNSEQATALIYSSDFISNKFCY